MTLTRNIKTLDELDLLLDRYATDIDGFAAKAKRRAQDWNRQEIDLELRDPLSWRKPVNTDVATTSRGVASIEEQLRKEIDNLTIMDREEEARHARRIEFARFRLEHALQRASLTMEDIDGKVSYDPTTKKVAAGGYDGEVRIWNVADGKELVTFTAAPGYKKPDAAASASK